MVIAEALRVKTSPRKNMQRLNPEKCSYVYSGWRNSNRRRNSGTQSTKEVRGRGSVRTEAVARA